MTDRSYTLFGAREELRAAAINYSGDRSRQAGDSDTPSRRMSLQDWIISKLVDSIIWCGSSRFKRLMYAILRYSRLSIYEDWPIEPFESEITITDKHGRKVGVIKPKDEGWIARSIHGGGCWFGFTEGAIKWLLDYDRLERDEKTDKEIIYDLEHELKIVKKDNKRLYDDMEYWTNYDFTREVDGITVR